MFLNGEPIDWKQDVVYLGNKLSYNLSDEFDINKKHGDFVYSINSLMNHFRKLSFKLLNNLFIAYCTAFYGCQTWWLEHKCIDNLYRTYNKAVRKIWCLPDNSHREIIYGVSNCKSLHEILLMRFCKMYDVMLNSENNIVRYIAHIAKDDCSSPLGKNIKHVKQYLKCECDDTQLYTCCKQFISSKGRLRAVGHKVLSIKELIDVKESCMTLDIHLNMK